MKKHLRTIIGDYYIYEYNKTLIIQQRITWFDIIFKIIPLLGIAPLFLMKLINIVASFDILSIKQIVLAIIFYGSLTTFSFYLLFNIYQGFKKYTLEIKLDLKIVKSRVSYKKIEEFRIDQIEEFIYEIKYNRAQGVYTYASIQIKTHENTIHDTFVIDNPYRVDMGYSKNKIAIIGKAKPMCNTLNAFISKTSNKRDDAEN